MKDNTHAELACEAAKALSFNCIVEGPRLPCKLEFKLKWCIMNYFLKIEGIMKECFVGKPPSQSSLFGTPPQEALSIESAD